MGGRRKEGEEGEKGMGEEEEEEERNVRKKRERGGRRAGEREEVGEEEEGKKRGGRGGQTIGSTTIHNMIWHVPGLPLLLNQTFAACLLGLVELYMFKWHKHIYMNMSICSIITEQALVVAREKGILI